MRRKVINVFKVQMAEICLVIPSATLMDTEVKGLLLQHKIWSFVVQLEFGPNQLEITC